MSSILYTITVFDPGAVPNILLDLAPYIQKAGWKIDIVALQAPPKDQSAVKRAEEMGIQVHSLGVPSWNIPGAIGKLRRFIRKGRWNLVHSHLGRADLVTSWAKPKNLPQVTTFHSVRRNFHPLTRWGYQLTDGLVAHRTGVSQACLDSFYGVHGLKSPHSVIYNPVSLERITSNLTKTQARRVLGLGDGPVIVQVGRMIPVKGHSLTLHAFSQLVKKHPKAQLIFVGSGPLEPSLREESEFLGIVGKIVWTGFISPSEVYPAADMVVFPSLWEGLGLVPIEAMMLGIPVVASDIPAVREYIEHEKQGLLFPPGDSFLLAQAMEESLTGQGKAERIDSGKKRALAMFSAALIAEQYLSLYSRIGGAV